MVFWSLHAHGSFAAQRKLGSKLHSSTFKKGCAKSFDENQEVCREEVGERLECVRGKYKIYNIMKQHLLFFFQQILTLLNFVVLISSFSTLPLSPSPMEQESTTNSTALKVKLPFHSSSPINSSLEELNLSPWKNLLQMNGRSSRNTK